MPDVKNAVVLQSYKGVDFAWCQKYQNSVGCPGSHAKWYGGEYQAFLKMRNDNGGKVLSNNETASAFTHFTFEASNHELLVVDIQGVKDEQGV